MKKYTKEDPQGPEPADQWEGYKGVKCCVCGVNMNNSSGLYKKDGKYYCTPDFPLEKKDRIPDFEAMKDMALRG